MVSALHITVITVITVNLARGPERHYALPNYPKGLLGGSGYMASSDMFIRRTKTIHGDYREPTPDG